MRVISVLDLRHGRAVHARGGERARYGELRSVLAPEVPGDAVAVARGVRAEHERRAGDGRAELYVADLDAIEGGAPQRALVRALAAECGILLDAGIAGVHGAEEALAIGAARVVVGLETLRAFGDLAVIAERCGGERVAFSLDLRAGEPVAWADAPRSASAVELAEMAVESGAGAVIVLDLARVGMESGLDLALLREIRRRLSRAELLAGGGVRDAGDLARMADCGCDAALVGTAVHEGRIALYAPPAGR
ncbi:MAG TPA: HisA/HisF-related TIM barrel protein [Gemmatimonadaceae bacterium]|nr:HisA/HisF-related TIM barrel protein [Gemmatimonadaceae bacterium]